MFVHYGTRGHSFKIQRFKKALGKVLALEWSRQTKARLRRAGIGDAEAEDGSGETRPLARAQRDIRQGTAAGQRSIGIVMRAPWSSSMPG